MLKNVIYGSLATVAALTTSATAGPKSSSLGNEKSPWDVSFDTGLDYSSGNTDSLSIRAGLNAERIREFDELYLGAGLNYGELEGTTTNEEVYAFAQYNKLITERAYFGLRSDFLYDDIAALDYRVSVTPLLGYYLIKNDRTKLAVEAGVGYQWEKQSGITDSFAIAQFNERFEHQLTPGLKFWQTFSISPELQDFGNYTYIARAGIETTLSDSWSLLTWVEDRYDSDVPDGIENNDIGVYAALSYALTRDNTLAPIGGSKAGVSGSGSSSPWDISLSTGFAYTDGNSDTLLVTAAIDAYADFGTHEIILGAGGAYGESESILSEQRVYANAQYNKTLSGPYYAGARVDFLYDKISLVDYRVTPAALLGVHLIQNDDTRLSVEAGPGYTFEKLSGEAADSYFSVYIGERFNHKVSDRLSIYQSLTVNLDTSKTPTTTCSTHAPVSTSNSPKK